MVEVLGACGLESDHFSRGLKGRKRHPRSQPLGDGWERVKDREGNPDQSGLQLLDRGSRDGFMHRSQFIKRHAPYDRASRQLQPFIESHSFNSHLDVT